MSWPWDRKKIALEHIGVFHCICQSIHSPSAPTFSFFFLIVGGASGSYPGYFYLYSVPGSRLPTCHHFMLAQHLQGTFRSLRAPSS